MGKTGLQTSAKDRASQLDDPGRLGAAWNPMSSSCQPTGSGKQPNLCSKEEPLALHFPYSLLLFSAVPFLKACFHIFRSLMLQANHGCTSESRTKTNHRPLLPADFPLLGLQSRPPVLHLSRSPQLIHKRHQGYVPVPPQEPSSPPHPHSLYLTLKTSAASWQHPSYPSSLVNYFPMRLLWVPPPFILREACSKSSCDSLRLRARIKNKYQLPFLS